MSIPVLASRVDKYNNALINQVNIQLVVKIKTVISKQQIE